MIKNLFALNSLTLILTACGSASLPHASVAVCHQVTTLDRSKLSRHLGALPPETFQEVEEGLKAAMDLE